jgi:hypothetical protein
MILRTFSTWLAACLAMYGESATAQVLYDAGLGTLPGAQSWTYFAFPGTASQSMAGGAAQLDTTAQISEQAGYSRTAPVPLDRTNGFTLKFNAQVVAEGHASTNRAGFSVIVLAQDKRGIELGFWTNAIFAQADSPLFTHAEQAVYNTSAQFTDYALTMLPTNYVLRANGAIILSGSIRDYTSFTGPIDPYETPNFIFLGDDTTSALATMKFTRVSLLSAPRLDFVAPNLVHWSGVKGETYTVHASSNLVHWAILDTVTSTTLEFYYTNSLADPARFLRVSWP